MQCHLVNGEEYLIAAAEGVAQWLTWKHLKNKFYFKFSYKYTYF